MRGRCRRHRGEDYVPNAFDISQHFIIPETQDTIAMIDQPSVSDGVALASGLASARPQVRFWGEADLDRQAKPAGSVENDP